MSIRDLTPLLNERVNVVTCFAGLRGIHDGILESIEAPRPDGRGGGLRLLLTKEQEYMESEPTGETQKVIRKRRAVLGDPTYAPGFSVQPLVDDVCEAPVLRKVTRRRAVRVHIPWKGIQNVHPFGADFETRQETRPVVQAVAKPARPDRRPSAEAGIERGAQARSEAEIDTAILTFSRAIKRLGRNDLVTGSDGRFSRVYTIRLKNQILGRPTSDKPIGPQEEWEEAERLAPAYLSDLDPFADDADDASEQSASVALEETACHL